MELNALELDFLFAIDFDLGVHPADYAACTADLRAFAAAKSLPADAHLPAVPSTALLSVSFAGPAAAQSTVRCKTTSALAVGRLTGRNVAVGAAHAAQGGTIHNDSDSADLECSDAANSSPPPSGPGPIDTAAAGPDRE